MIWSAWARSANSTKAKPRGRPVSRSTGMTMWEGSATAAKCARRSASLAPYGRFPMNRRTAKVSSSVPAFQAASDSISERSTAGVERARKRGVWEEQAVLVRGFQRFAAGQILEDRHDRGTAALVEQRARHDRALRVREAGVVARERAEVAGETGNRQTAFVPGQLGISPLAAVRLEHHGQSFVEPQRDAVRRDRLNHRVRELV